MSSCLGSDAPFYFPQKSSPALSIRCCGISPLFSAPPSICPNQRNDFSPILVCPFPKKITPLRNESPAKKLDLSPFNDDYNDQDACDEILEIVAKRSCQGSTVDYSDSPRIPVVQKLDSGLGNCVTESPIVRTKNPAPLDPFYLGGSLNSLENGSSQPSFPEDLPRDPVVVYTSSHVWSRPRSLSVGSKPSKLGVCF